ncbi:precorrin-6y C5,15-methyltransferase (decarboxylating) subunit CbiE [Pedobacter sp. MC2016-15]|uniref:precorrin-6y C5,15-methyltransferase (decarboxylating) subunit CbiE n=1 Tax=Pedobacter sp. MC2016-15 TaxID=2994473 RepID=UPI002246B665|nr:precorrin-6y C5,15-methyltransferase (decarboxylating) subunit CbiE [Pedobacter sp. MC2016-15]MCX2481344.1 precorrin-6y C5,15-methyltransferase (decarboxylating) subunit CbiE [Pedobacter sp. MC2016-15]
MVFQVIGIGNRKAQFATETADLIARHTVFSGGHRHYELVGHLLPEGHIWLPVQAPMEVLYESYLQANTAIVVFASGDPLFYGIGNTLRAKFPDAEIHTYPYFSSIQLLLHKAQLSANQLQTVSVHGRPWTALDEIIIQQKALIGVLTDAEKSPSAIAKRLLEYGYTNYTMWIGEDLEAENESVQQLTLQETAESAFHHLNCVILQKEKHRKIAFGIDDQLFEGLEGRPNMITKMPVRLCSLHSLDLESKSVLWDIGFCTGSLSIEAKLRFPQLQVHAFEQRPECLEILHKNQRRFGSPGIQAWMGDIFDTALSDIPKPQAVFIGGHGGRLTELLQRIDQYLPVGGTMVINAVQQDSITDFTAFASRPHWKLDEPLQLKVNAHNEITILKATKQKC